MRKPVQIVTGAIGEPYGDEKNGTEVIGHTIYALCDDGSIWRLYNDGWLHLDDIPQDEPEQPAASPNVVAALRELANAEKEFRSTYQEREIFDAELSLKWRLMRVAGDAARELLQRIDEQEAPR